MGVVLEVVRNEIKSKDLINRTSICRNRIHRSKHLVDTNRSLTAVWNHNFRDHYTRVIKRYQPEAKTIDTIIEMADPATVNYELIYMNEVCGPTTVQQTLC